jgi:glycosyltransferase involved in cell wall biosynthesis
MARGHEVSVLYYAGEVHWRDTLRSWYMQVRYRQARDWLDRFDGKKIPYRTLSPDRVGEHDILIAVGPVAARAIASLPERCGVKIEHVRGSAQAPAVVLEAWRRPWPKIVVATHLKRAIEDQGCGPVAAVVPHGVDADEYFPDGDESARAGVGTVWHQAKVKGPDVILAVLHELRRRFPSLPIEMFSHQPRPADLLGRTRFVRFPTVPRARRMYSRCKVWFCASRSEGMPNPVMEAMASGCAVVSTDCGGPADVIRDGENGYLVPVDDVAALTDRAAALLTDDALRRRIVVQSRQTAARLTWPNAVAQLEAALVDIRNGSFRRSAEAVQA